MSSPTIVLAQLEVQDCTAELYVNGVPALRAAPRNVPLHNIAVEDLIIPGTNRLDLIIEPGPRPAEAGAERREITYRPMGAAGRLICFPEGVPGLVEYGHLIANVGFQWTGEIPARRVFPIEETTHVDLGPAHGRWGWQDAPLLNLDEALFNEACALLDKVEAVLRARRADEFWQLTELQIRDVLRAYPALHEPQLRAELATLMAHYEKIDDPVMPRDRSQHDFRLVAGGRLLQLIDRDWTTSFKLRDPIDRSPVPYRIFVARIGGELRIVR
jgi:hypothetical protein